MAAVTRKIALIKDSTDFSDSDGEYEPPVKSPREGSAPRGSSARMTAMNAPSTSTIPSGQPLPTPPRSDDDDKEDFLEKVKALPKSDFLDALVDAYNKKRRENDADDWGQVTEVTPLPFGGFGWKDLAEREKTVSVSDDDFSDSDDDDDRYKKNPLTECDGDTGHQRLYTPIPEWEAYADIPIEEPFKLSTLNAGAMCEAYIKRGKLGDKWITYISKTWALSRDWSGFHSELAIYASSKYLRTLQGDVVPTIIGVYLLEGEISVAMALPDSTFWIEASRDMPDILKRKCLAAYEKIHERGVLQNDVELRHMLIGGNGAVTIIDFQNSAALLGNSDVHLEACTTADLRHEKRKLLYKLDVGNARAKEHERRRRNYERIQAQRRVARLIELKKQRKFDGCLPHVPSRNRDDVENPAISDGEWADGWENDYDFKSSAYCNPSVSRPEIQAAVKAFYRKYEAHMPKPPSVDPAGALPPPRSGVHAKRKRGDGSDSDEDSGEERKPWKVAKVAGAASPDASVKTGPSDVEVARARFRVNNWLASAGPGEAKSASNDDEKSSSQGSDDAAGPSTAQKTIEVAALDNASPSSESASQPTNDTSSSAATGAAAGPSTDKAVPKIAQVATGNDVSPSSENASQHARSTPSSTETATSPLLPGSSSNPIVIDETSPDTSTAPPAPGPIDPLCPILHVPYEGYTGPHGFTIENRFTPQQVAKMRRAWIIQANVLDCAAAGLPYPRAEREGLTPATDGSVEKKRARKRHKEKVRAAFAALEGVDPDDVRVRTKKDRAMVARGALKRKREDEDTGRESWEGRKAHWRDMDEKRQRFFRYWSFSQTGRRTAGYEAEDYSDMMANESEDAELGVPRILGVEEYEERYAPGSGRVFSAVYSHRVPLPPRPLPRSASLKPPPRGILRSTRTEEEVWAERMLKLAKDGPPEVDSDVDMPEEGADGSEDDGSPPRGSGTVCLPPVLPAPGEGSAGAGGAGAGSTRGQLRRAPTPTPMPTPSASPAVQRWPILPFAKGLLPNRIRPRSPSPSPSASSARCGTPAQTADSRDHALGPSVAEAPTPTSTPDATSGAQDRSWPLPPFPPVRLPNIIRPRSPVYSSSASSRRRAPAQAGAGAGVCGRAAAAADVDARAAATAAGPPAPISTPTTSASSAQDQNRPLPPLPPVLLPNTIRQRGAIYSSSASSRRRAPAQAGVGASVAQRPDTNAIAAAVEARLALDAHAGLGASSARASGRTNSQPVAGPSRQTVQRHYFVYNASSPSPSPSPSPPPDAGPVAGPSRSPLAPRQAGTRSRSSSEEREVEATLFG